MQTVDTQSIRTTTPEVTPDTRETRALELYRDHGRDIECVAPDVYLVPSCTSEGQLRYRVHYGEIEACECKDFEFGHDERACKHILAAGISVAKRRARRSPCDGCGVRRPVRELVVLHEDNHDTLTHFHGDMLCPACADAAGVEY